MRLAAEFTIEPFVDGAPGPHVDAGIAAVRDAGLDVELGPFGTTATGDVARVAEAVAALLRAATAAGATRVSVQVSALDG